MVKGLSTGLVSASLFQLAETDLELGHRVKEMKITLVMFAFLNGMK